MIKDVISPINLVKSKFIDDIEEKISDFNKFWSEKIGIGKGLCFVNVNDKGEIEEYFVKSFEDIYENSYGLSNIIVDENTRDLYVELYQNNNHCYNDDIKEILDCLANDYNIDICGNKTEIEKFISYPYVYLKEKGIEKDEINDILSELNDSKILVCIGDGLESFFQIFNFYELFYMLNEINDLLIKKIK